MAYMERRLYPLPTHTALIAGECARIRILGQQRSGPSFPSRKGTEMTVMEMVSFLQNDNKMRIKMNGVNHVESPIITDVHSLLIL